jgi:hypothetical protein
MLHAFPPLSEDKLSMANVEFVNEAPKGRLEEMFL